ncbi:NAD(P)H-dependent oxidoreductase [Agrilactobacillus fermenti]|uniref:NAD(P)H-dependent oxidoreductase n=1 Tax=Agrilactobacillus fermenti TaxID=2586909 RepID=UPI001E601D12|nr:NAD(P)H-dependent oxidoreductase [Agrilactobacillus fermenti]MCD2255727.1 NAD(P)H-dependent oxidoreductase [Agrilactobacillus fermenti]
MRTLVVIAHPDYDNSGTQAFLQASAQSLSQVTWHILDQVYPDLHMDIIAERQLIQQADQIIFQFPLYWYSAPASLYAWLDQVLQTKHEETLPDFSGKILGLVVSTGTDQKQFAAGRQEQFTLSEYLRPFEGIARKVNLQYRAPLIISQFSYLSEQQKMHLLITYQQYLTLKTDHFAQRQTWLIQRLQTLVKNTEAESQLTGIIAALEANQEHLTDLTETLQMLKGEPYE